MRHVEIHFTSLNSLFSQNCDQYIRSDLHAFSLHAAILWFNSEVKGEEPEENPKRRSEYAGRRGDTLPLPCTPRTSEVTITVREGSGQSYASSYQQQGGRDGQGYNRKRHTGGLQGLEEREGRHAYSTVDRDPRPEQDPRGGTLPRRGSKGGRNR
jgi:hypothetical protein